MQYSMSKASSFSVITQSNEVGLEKNKLLKFIFRCSHRDVQWMSRGSKNYATNFLIKVMELRSNTRFTAMARTFSSYKMIRTWKYFRNFSSNSIFSWVHMVPAFGIPSNCISKWYLHFCNIECKCDSPISCISRYKRISKACIWDCDEFLKHHHEQVKRNAQKSCAICKKRYFIRDLLGIQLNVKYPTKC